MLKFLSDIVKYYGVSEFSCLRMDTLAQLLTYANVRAGSRLLVVESCLGLVVGALMERMGGRCVGVLGRQCYQ